MSESDLLDLYPRTPMSSHPVKLPHGISHFDTLEYLRYEAQDLLQLLSNLADRNAESTELVTAREKLSGLMQGWDAVLENLQQDRREAEAQVSKMQRKLEDEKLAHEEVRKALQNKIDQSESSWGAKESALQREINAIKVHLEEGKDVWAAQMKLIEKSMQDQEASKQKMETRYRDNMAEVERELDELVHDYKARKRGAKAFGSILPSLFSPEELDFEDKKALGEAVLPRFPDLPKIPKLEDSDQQGEKWDINIESEESSEMSVGKLSHTAKQLYARLRDLRISVNRYKHEEVSDVSSMGSSQSGMESLDKGFIASLPSGLKSITHSVGELGLLVQNLNTDLAKFGLNKSFQVRNRDEKPSHQLDEVMLIAGIVFRKPKKEESLPGTEGVPMFPLTNLSQDAGFLHQLEKELMSPQGHDVKLEDLLRLDPSPPSPPHIPGAPSNKFGDTLELSCIPPAFKDDKRDVGSLSGTDLKDLIQDVHLPLPIPINEERTPEPEQPSVIVNDSHSSHGGEDSMLDFLNSHTKLTTPQEKAPIFDVSGVSDILVCDEACGKSGKKLGVPKLPLHLLKKQPSSKPPASPSIDLEDPIAFLQEESPEKDPEPPSAAKKFSPLIREPDLSINLSIQNESSISQAQESVSNSLAFKMNSFFDLAPPKQTAAPEEKKEKQSSSRGKMVPLVPEPRIEEQKSLLVRRAKMNETETTEEQVSVTLPKLNATVVEDTGGYQTSQSKLATSFDENPAFRPRAGPISMQRKLPILPVKPEAAPGKFNRGGMILRGRPLQPIHPNRIGVSKPTSPSIVQPSGQSESSHPPPDAKFRSESPNLFNKFRIRRFKESERPALKLVQKLPSVVPQRPVAALHPQV